MRRQLGSKTDGETGIGEARRRVTITLALPVALLSGRRGGTIALLPFPPRPISHRLAACEFSGNESGFYGIQSCDANSREVTFHLDKTKAGDSDGISTITTGAAATEWELAR